MNVKNRELKHNELADFLGHQADNFKTYGKPVIGTVISVIVLAALFQYSRVQSAQQEANLWAQYIGATSTNDFNELKAIGEKHPNTKAGNWSLLMLGDFKLGQAVSDLTTNRTEVRNSLQDAKEAYEKAKSSRDIDIQQRAALGLAKALEAQGELNNAKEQYQEVAAKWPKTVFAEQAETRLADIERRSVKEFYDWLARQEARSPLGDAPGIPGLRPSGLDNLPSDLGDFKLGHPPITPKATDAPKGDEIKAPETDKTPAETPKANSSPEKK